MKRILPMLLLVFMLTACAAQVAQLQQLPDEGVNLIWLVVTAGVLWALLQLSAIVKVDLGGYKDMIAAILAPIIVTIVQNYLQLIPSIYDNVVLSLIHLLVLFVGGSFGVFLLAKHRKS